MGEPHCEALSAYATATGAASRAVAQQVPSQSSVARLITSSPSRTRKFLPVAKPSSSSQRPDRCTAARKRAARDC